jgi:hypothetical protein
VVGVEVRTDARRERVAVDDVVQGRDVGLGEQGGHVHARLDAGSLTLVTVSYRDDRDASFERAEALEDELAREKAEHEHDKDRIAALEKELAAARKNAPKPEPPPKKKPSPSKDEIDELKRKSQRNSRIMQFSLIGVMVLGAVGFATWKITAARRVANGWVVADWLAEAWKDAKSWQSDAELVKLHAEFVDPTGRAQLDKYSGSLSITFRSPSRALAGQPPAADVAGAPVKDNRPTCSIRFRSSRKSNDLSSSESRPSGANDVCGESLPGPPNCTVVDVWQKAVAKGAPNPGLATIDLTTKKGARSWRFIINDNRDGQNPQTFDITVADDECKH